MEPSGRGVRGRLKGRSKSVSSSSLTALIIRGGILLVVGVVGCMSLSLSPGHGKRRLVVGCEDVELWLKSRGIGDRDPIPSVFGTRKDDVVVSPDICRREKSGCARRKDRGARKKISVRTCELLTSSVVGMEWMHNRSITILCLWVTIAVRFTILSEFK